MPKVKWLGAIKVGNDLYQCYCRLCKLHSQSNKLVWINIEKRHNNNLHHTVVKAATIKVKVTYRLFNNEIQRKIRL